MLWHIKLVKITLRLWICRSHSIWWKLDFCQLCSITAGCNFYNQLLFTVCCLITVGWIKANRVSSLPILFCPLTVYLFKNTVYLTEFNRIGFECTIEQHGKLKKKWFFFLFPLDNMEKNEKCRSFHWKARKIEKKIWKTEISPLNKRENWWENRNIVELGNWHNEKI